MRSQTPEKRGTQKIVRSPTYRIENEYNPEAMAQYFQHVPFHRRSRSWSSRSFKILVPHAFYKLSLERKLLTKFLPAPRTITRGHKLLKEFWRKPEDKNVVIHVLENKGYKWINSQSNHSYYVVVLGKNEHKIKSSRRGNVQKLNNGDVFNFNLHARLSELQHYNIRLAVIEAKCTGPRILGETSINLGEIWSQPDHQVFHKWVQLIPAGFVKLNVTILYRSKFLMLPAVINNKEENRLTMSPLSQLQPANYVVTIYSAIGLLNNNIQVKNRSKNLNAFINITLCSVMTKTAVQPLTNNILYREQISLVQYFPNTSQMISFEVWVNEGTCSRIVANACISLADISQDGENGFLPTFGPSLLYLYSTCNNGTHVNFDGSYYRGALLVACKVIAPYYQKKLNSLSVEPAPPIKMDGMWAFEDFCIYCPIFEVSMIDQKISEGSCGVAITVGEIDADIKTDEDFMDMLNETRLHKLHYTGNLKVSKSQYEYGFIDFNKGFPILQFAIWLPDFRLRMYGNNIITNTVHILESSLSDIENHIKSFDYASLSEVLVQLIAALEKAMESIVNFLQHFYENGTAYERCYTELDRKQFMHRNEEMNRILRLISKIINSTENTKKINQSRKNIKLLIGDTKMVLQDLKKLVFKSPEGWPDVVVWLLSGGSRVAFYKIPMSNIIHSDIPDQNGRYCGDIQTIFAKPIKCSKHHENPVDCNCVAGKIELLLWMGPYKLRSCFESRLQVNGFEIKRRDYDMCIQSQAMMIECSAVICKANLCGDCYEFNSLQFFVRINALNTVCETKVKCKTLTPAWNQVLKIQRMVLMTSERLEQSPPIVLVEVYNTELSTETLVGRIPVEPNVKHTLEMPKFKWYNLYRGLDCTGRILMYVQMTQIPERLLKSILYNPVDESYVAPCIREQSGSDDYIPLPNHLLPVSSSYKVDVYWWGLRGVEKLRKGVVLEIEDLIIKSDIIINSNSNCNFPNGKISHILEAQLNEAYCPMLNVRLFDSSSYGRKQYCADVSKYSNKYFVRWLPKTDRDASLTRASICSTEFIQVNHTLFIKRSSQSSRNNTNRNSFSINNKNNSSAKSIWKNLFWKRDLNEEELSLLPMFSASTQYQISDNGLSGKQKEKDWWSKYCQSYEVSAGDEEVCIEDKLIIYNSELESQPQFSKMKDWCSTLKLYNGKKTDKPEQDARLYCGTLKAGLAIYRWPPPGDKTAVTFNGIDLSKGIFYDHPNNDPAKFLIRVYIVRAINFKTNMFGKASSYVILSCGNNYLRDRNSQRLSQFNSIIGKMFELRCSLPEDYLLGISFYNNDTIAQDEFIGSTTIDLENRIYSKHRARVGLANKYKMNDSLVWRDSMKPSAILQDICSKNHLPAPVFIDNRSLVFNGVEYKDDNKEINFLTAAERKENLCLSILLKWYTMPVCGYHLVPEHVETRSLYHVDKPEVEQGKIVMWVDIFPFDTGSYIPPPIDITPKAPEAYELQVIIYSVRLKDKDAGCKFSALYIKAWLGFIELSQSTELTMKCSNAQRTFNWRMIFPFEYYPSIRKITCKGIVLSNELNDLVSPTLDLQLIDNKALPPNDILGFLRLKLNAMDSGLKHFDKYSNTNCSEDIDLFSVNCHRAWWPLIVNSDQNQCAIVGKIELELSLLSQGITTFMAGDLGRNLSLPLEKSILQQMISDGLCRTFTKFYRQKTLTFIVIILCLFIVITVALALFFDLPEIILEYWGWM